MNAQPPGNVSSRERFYYARKIGEEFGYAARASTEQEQIEHRSRAMLYVQKLKALSER